MRELTGEGTVDSPKDMAEIAARYHETLQYQEHNPIIGPEGTELEEILSRLRARVLEMSREKLAEDTNEDQVREALRQTNREKAPGLDRIPVELWKLMDDQFLEANKRDEPNCKCDIVWILTQVFLDIEEYGMDARAELNKGCMTPIYKKKSPDDIANYRPITLNTDYKIYTKALSIRLAEVVPQVVNKDQAGFIQNRSIFDQVKTTKMVIDYMERMGRRGAVVALDQEKAYDKILHPYLWAVLERFSFPPRFIGTIRALYAGARTKILINGELSRPIRIVRGVHQGDPLSCLLFDLAIEPLAESVRRAENLRGIQIPTQREHLKIKLFADDTTVFLLERDEIRDLQRVLSQWCAVSGAKFNIEKTEIIPMGTAAQRQQIVSGRRLHEDDKLLPNTVHVARDGEPVRILGAWLGNEVDQATTWAPIVEDCNRRLRQWGAAGTGGK